MTEVVTTRVLRDSETFTPNGAGVTVKNDEWQWGAQGRTNEGTVFVQSNYASSTMKTQIDYKPGSLTGTLTATRTSGNLTFIGAVNNSGHLTGGGQAKIGNSTYSFNTQAGFGVSHTFPSGLGSVNVALNPSSSLFNVTFRDSGNRPWGFLFSTGYSSSSGWSFGSSIFSSSFL